MNTKVLTFSSKKALIDTSAGTSQTIRKVVELKLKSLIARARVACQHLAPAEVAGLENQALTNFFESQKNSTPEIETAIARFDHKIFQSYAVQIAALVTKGDFETAADLLQETIENFSLMIITIFASGAEAETEYLAAA